MTPEVKAKGDELIEKFRNELSWIEKDHNVDLWRDARQCAIIAVEEIISVNHGNAWSNIPGVTIKEYYTQVLNYLKSKL